MARLEIEVVVDMFAMIKVDCSLQKRRGYVHFALSWKHICNVRHDTAREETVPGFRCSNVALAYFPIISTTLRKQRTSYCWSRHFTPLNVVTTLLPRCNSFSGDVACCNNVRKANSAIWEVIALNLVTFIHRLRCRDKLFIRASWTDINQYEGIFEKRLLYCNTCALYRTSRATICQKYRPYNFIIKGKIKWRTRCTAKKETVLETASSVGNGKNIEMQLGDSFKETWYQTCR